MCLIEISDDDGGGSDDFAFICCIKHMAIQFRHMADNAWKQVHRLLMFPDEWHLEQGVDGICIYSQQSSSLGKIRKLDVSNFSVCAVLVCPAH